MTRAQDDLQARARKRYQALRRKQRDPRFRKVMGRFVAEGLLATTIEGIPPHDKRVPLEDALWAGTVEPRIMELLPAVLVKKPRLLRLPKELPDDVAAVMHAIRHGKAAPSFRGVAPDRYLPWVTEVGRKGKSPSVLKSFRFKHEDVLRLSRLRRDLPARSDTEVIRMALELLAREARRAQRRRYARYPGGDRIARGLKDLEKGRESIDSLLVSIGAPRLRRLGFDIERPLASAEHRLYELLAQEAPNRAHSRYNALIRRLVSFERALECAA